MYVYESCNEDVWHDEQEIPRAIAEQKQKRKSNIIRSIYLLLTHSHTGQLISTVVTVKVEMNSLKLLMNK